MFQIKQLKEPLRMWGEILAPLQNISNEWGEKKKKHLTALSIQMLHCCYTFIGDQNQTFMVSMFGRNDHCVQGKAP